MKTYEGKTESEVVQLACQDLGVTPNELKYEVIEEKKSLFSKKVVIQCYTRQMVYDFIGDYVKTILTNMEFGVETVVYEQDKRI